MYDYMILQLGPGHGTCGILLYFDGVALGPFAHQLAHNLAAGQLGNFIDDGNAAFETLVLCDAGGDPVLDVSGGDLTLGGLLESYVGAWPFATATEEKLDVLPLR